MVALVTLFFSSRHSQLHTSLNKILKRLTEVKVENAAKVCELHYRDYKIMSSIILQILEVLCVLCEIPDIAKLIISKLFTNNSSSSKASSVLRGFLQLLEEKDPVYSVVVIDVLRLFQKLLIQVHTHSS